MMTIPKYLFLVSILVVVFSLILTISRLEGNVMAIEESKFFAIQHAPSGSIAEINATNYTLELNNVSEKTILFSDRPNRIVMSISTNDFVGNWSAGEDSFTADAPNAVLVVDAATNEQDTAIIELFNPTYDLDEKTLKYEITPDNATSIELQSKFGRSTLVIDVVHPTQY